MKKKLLIIIPVIIILSALLIRIPRLNSKFIGPNESDNVMYSLAARNNLRFGYLATKATNCFAVGTDEIKLDDYYTNHSGVLPIVLAGAFSIFGESESVTRIVALLFSFSGIILIYLMVKRRENYLVGIFTLILVSFFPISAWYGKVASHVVIILPFAILLLDSIGTNFEKDEMKWRYGTPLEIILAFIISMIDYGGTLIIPALLLGFGFRRRFIGPALAVAVANLFLFLQVIYIKGFYGLINLFIKASHRMGIKEGLTWSDFLYSQFQYFSMNGFTPIVLLFLVIGIIFFGNMNKIMKRISASFAAWGLLYIFIFREAAVVHDFWQYYLIPSVAIFSANALSRMPRWLALILLLIFMDQSVRILNRRYYSDTGWYAYEFKAIKFALENAKDDDIILCRKPVRSQHPAYYGDRRFQDAPYIETEFAILHKVSSR
ncbi:TPA: hypothetical protein DEF17_03470 [bacterium]|nr:MAG: hypothetical protein AUJ18_08815 [Candidatus Hydrogenedentes bacterium CG1_02_42_14]PIU47851.1 MAG: hypothetical protein COS94_05290 [Candidatus Hydrogenedentes bacterium CG07_land_8_20_14_0_80_42_17]HBW46977.1 hypothetical protein [bacterium]